MSAYLIFNRIKTVDAAELATYMALVPGTRPGHELKALVSFGKHEVLEGAATDGMAVLEFADAAAARAWFHSPAYQAASVHRSRGADYSVVLIDGV